MSGLLPLRPPRLAVTGTDTGVGKTLVTCALVTALRTAGLRVAAMKPVETGVTNRGLTDRGASTDADRLRRAAGGTHLIGDVGPVTYVEPLAPLVAAARARRPVDLAVLDAARARLEAHAGALVVEGAGGLLVPFARRVGGEVVDFASLALHWRLDLVVVAANRLGVVNHVLLTIREAERRALTVRALVLTLLRPTPGDVAEATNADVLRDLLPGVPVIVFPFVPPAEQDDPVTLARVGAPLAAALAVQ